MNQGLHKHPLSWTNPKNTTLWSELEKDLSWPFAFKSPTVLRTGAEEGHYGLFMGPQGSGVSMHYHKSAWNALLYGRKLWVLTPPSQSMFRRNELAAKSFGNGPGGQGWFEEAVERSKDRAVNEVNISNRNNTESRRLYCVQRAGDVLFVPQGWGHSTMNLRESIGIANFFLDEDAVGYRPSKLFHSSRGIRSLQTAAGMTSPSDFDPDGHP